MEKVLEILSSFITADNVALLSVIITVFIFIFSRQAEIRYKKHDEKKAQYLKLIELLEKHFSGISKNRKGEITISDTLRKLFFDAGASLLMYGSKKIYRLYVLFREFNTNPLIKQCKYYKEDVTLYIMSEILVTMRKEVGLSYFNSVSNNEALAFFVNDISSNPTAKENAIEARFCMRMIKLELWMIDRTQFIWIKSLYNYLFRPVFAIFLLLFRYLFFIPLGRIIVKLFPNVAEKVGRKGKDT